MVRVFTDSPHNVQGKPPRVRSISRYHPHDGGDMVPLADVLARLRLRPALSDKSGSASLGDKLDDAALTRGRP
jgi:hypothetical protein